jgi:chromosome segregation ATPase
MWKQLVEFSKQLVALTRDVQQGKDTLKTHSEELKEIRQELKRALELLQDLRYEQHRNRENAMHEREKLTLRLENILLRTGGRLLPPGDQKGAEDTDELRQQIEALKHENEELKNFTFR